MLPADDLAGALAMESYSRAAEAFALAEYQASDEGCAFTQIQERILVGALIAAFDGCEESFRGSLVAARRVGAE